MVCKKGFLLVRRLGINLSRYDNCILCGQTFFYTDDNIAEENLVDEMNN